MSLELEVTNILGRGRRSASLQVLDVREATAADIKLFEDRPEPIRPDPIKRISERHHTVARLIAAGVPPGEVALITNYDPSRISTLQNSPAMIELIALYRREVDAEFAPVLENLAGMSKDAISIIRERLEEEPEKLSVNDLMKVAEMALDRTGHPRAKDINTTINVNLGERLEAARKRARQAALGQVVDAEIIGDSDGD